MSDTKHGWVTPRADGARARCGGPGVCATCDTEAMHEAMLTGVFGVVPTATPSWLDGGADAVEMAREDGLLPAAPCQTCNDQGAVGNILTAQPCPDCTPPASAQDDAKDEKPYCYALETRGRWGDENDVLLDVEYNATDSFSGGRTGGIPLYRRPDPAAGDARDAARYRTVRQSVADEANGADQVGAAAEAIGLRRGDYPTPEQFDAMVDHIAASQQQGDA